MADESEQTYDEAPGRPSDQESPGERPDGDEPGWQRRRRLASVFGDVLPDTTSDERGPEVAAEENAADRWLRNEVPPHHG